MNKKAHLAGIGFASVFGLSFMFSKIVLASISPIGLIAYRFLIAFFVFELLRIAKVVTIRFHKEYIVPVLMVALFQPILYFFFETYGLAKTSSGEAGMMIALIPIFVSIFGMLILKEKPRLIQIFFVVLSVSGILFIQLSKPEVDMESEGIGFVLLFLAVLSAAMFNIASRKASLKVKPYEVTYFMMLAGALVFNVVYVVELGVEHNLSQYFTNLLAWDVVLPILYLGIIASIGGFFLVNYALSKLPAHVSSVYSNLSTIVAVIAGALILSEKLYYYHFIGGLMIVIGVYGTVMSNRVAKVGKINQPIGLEANQEETRE